MKLQYENYYITDDKEMILARCQDVQELLKQSYWADKRSIETWKTAIKNSDSYAVIETATDKLVGFARTVSDYATIYYLNDVLIDEAHRGKGLGKRLVHYIVLEDEKFVNIEGLLKTRDARDLYLKYGFKESIRVCMDKLTY